MRTEERYVDIWEYTGMPIRRLIRMILMDAKGELYEKNLEISELKEIVATCREKMSEIVREGKTGTIDPERSKSDTTLEEIGEIAKRCDVPLNVAFWKWLEGYLSHEWWTRLKPGDRFMVGGAEHVFGSFCLNSDRGETFRAEQCSPCIDRDVERIKEQLGGAKWDKIVKHIMDEMK